MTTGERLNTDGSNGSEPTTAPGSVLAVEDLYRVEFQRGFGSLPSAAWVERVVESKGGPPRPEGSQNAATDSSERRT
jgi:hypothetical protein